MSVKHKELIHVSQDELTKLEGEETPKCKMCGKSIWYDTTKVSYRLDGKLSSEFGGTTYRTSKNINGICYPICICQHCLEKKYPDFSEKNKSKIFNTFNKYVEYAFDIPKNVIDEKNKSSVPTLENCIRKHGEEKGREIFDEYKRKQAYTNSFEYKQNKYGWTKEQYDEYNKSRSVTLENLIKRHGEIEGRKIWENYCERQSYTSTNEYITETFGEERAKSISLLKAREFEGFVSMYGEIEGKKRFDEYIKSAKDRKHYSKLSKLFFDDLVFALKEKGFELKCFYAENEHWRWSNEKKLYFFDFYIHELNLVVEINGDYWHCNPNTYMSDYFHKLRHMTASEIWEYDKHRNDIITNEFGLNFDVIWESEIRKNKKDVILNLIDKIKELYVSKYKGNQKDKQSNN